MRFLNCLSLVALFSVGGWGSESGTKGCQVQVSLTGKEKIPKDVKLYLYRDERVLEKLKVKSDGRVNLPDLPAGDYQMLVSSGDMSIAGSRNVHLDPARDCQQTLVVQRSQGTSEKRNS